MQVEVNGTRLWYDVDAPVVVPDGARTRERPTVVLVHGGPATYDHTYFKPHFTALAGEAQLIYLDLRDHGRSARQSPADWSFDVCADDLRAFCDLLGIVKPIVLGHSMGGIVAMLYGARHPGHAHALVLQSTMARFELERIVDGFRRVAGDEVAALARRDYGCPTFVCCGDLDPVTPVAASHEIFDALSPGIGTLEIIDGAGHFPWLDAPDRYWSSITRFVTTTNR